MFHLLDCKAAKNVICVTDIVNVKATQASTFQFVMLGLIHWINLVIDNIMQLYFAFSQPKVFTLKQCFQFSLSPCVFVCVCVCQNSFISLNITSQKAEPCFKFANLYQMKKSLSWPCTPTNFKICQSKLLCDKCSKKKQKRTNNTNRYGTM